MKHYDNLDAFIDDFLPDNTNHDDFIVTLISTIDPLIEQHYQEFKAEFNRFPEEQQLPIVDGLVKVNSHTAYPVQVTYHPVSDQVKRTQNETITSFNHQPVKIPLYQARN